MAYNKITYAGKTLIDLSEDTVSAEGLLTGMTAHDKAGNKVTGLMEKPSIVLRKSFTANTGYSNFKNLGHIRLTVLDTNTNTTANARVRVCGAKSPSQLTNSNLTELSNFRLKKANNGIDQIIDTDMSFPYLAINPVYGDTWGSTAVPVEIEIYEDNALGILTSFKVCSDFKKVESSARTIVFGDDMVTTIHRTKTTSCCGTFWTNAVDLSDYKTLMVEYSVDQAGDGSSGYNNYVGFSEHYPGEPSINLDGNTEVVSPLVPYSIDFAACIALGNDVVDRKTAILDVSQLKGGYYPKITAGNAGFIIYRMLLSK